MSTRLFGWLLASICLFSTSAWADDYEETIAVFQKAGESASFFKNSYGYAVFPTIAKGGVGIGGAHGKGRVYSKGAYIGDTTMNQLTVGLQLGGQAYSQIVFFQDQRSLEEFTGGSFEFGAQATAVAITAGAPAQAGSTGASMGAISANAAGHAVATGEYHKGMAIFTVAKGGLMYEASVGGQKFSFKPNK